MGQPAHLDQDDFNQRTKSTCIKKSSLQSPYWSLSFNRDHEDPLRLNEPGPSEALTDSETLAGPPEAPPGPPQAPPLPVS